MLHAGIYWGLIQGAVCAEKDGKEHVVITARMTHFLGADNNYQPIAAQDRRVYLYFTEGAEQYTIKKLKALGFTGDFTAMDFDDKVKFEGVAFVCKQDTYNGKPSEKWDLKDWGGEVEQAGQDKLRRLNALWKSNAAPAQKPGGRPTAPPAATTKKAPPAPIAAPPAAEEAAAEAPVAMLDVKAATKEDAWAIFCDASHDQPDLQKWNALIKESGKPEARFTADDWQKLAEAAVCPI